MMAMNETAYWLCVAAALVLGMGWWAMRLKKKGMPIRAALYALPLSALLGYGLAWVLYAVLMARLSVSAYRYSFLGGVLGVCAGVLLGAKAAKAPLGRALDAFAPALCLLVAIARLAEGFMGSVGLGFYLETPFLCRFPFAVQNEWEEWYAAVFMLEAALALIALIVCLVRYGGKGAPGLTFERTAYLLAVPQVVSEQLRAMPMAWGFVRAEQIFCGVIAALLLGRACYKWHKRQGGSALRAWWPVPAIFALAGVVMAMEFALDGKIELPVALSWALLIGSVIAMLALEAYAAGRLLRAETK